MPWPGGVGCLSVDIWIVMSKLLSLKKWLTINEAARHLSILFEEQVSDADILRLGLDGNLVLSVYFVNHANAVKQKIIPIAEAEVIPSYFGDYNICMGVQWDEDNLIIEDGERVSIEGIFDLPKVGAAHLCVERHYQRMTGGPEVTLGCLGGTLVQEEDGTYWLLQDSMSPREIDMPDGTKKKFDRSYFPAGGLPEDSVLVVRTSALQLLVAPVNKQTFEKPVSTRERKTLLTIIAALAKAAKIPVDPPGKAALSIEGLTAEIGARVSKRAIEEHLKKIPDALESRME